MENPKQFERISPLQPRQSILYQEKSPSVEEALLNFCSTSVSQLPSVSALTDRFPIEVMASPPLQARFLQMLISLSGATKVLEIGTFIGLTTLALAQAVGDSGTVTTIEKGDEFGGIAKKNFDFHPLGKRITSYIGDASKIISTLPKELSFDFVFLDGAKEIYWEIFCVAKERMQPNSVLIADDVFCQGDALQKDPQTPKGVGTKKFVQSISADKDWSSTILPVFNGLLIAKRL